MKKYDRVNDIKCLIEELGVELKDVSELYLRYFAEMRIESGKMQEYVLKQRWDMLERVIHNIKGVSSSLNINDVYEKAAEFDVLLKNNKTDTAALHANELIALIRGAEEDIREIYPDWRI